MGLRLITPAATVPVSFEQLRNQCELASDDTTHDTQLGRLAAAATEFVERSTRRAFITQSWRWQTYRKNLYEIPRPPLITVNSITITADDGTEATIDPADCIVLTDPSPGLLRISDMQWSEIAETDREVVPVTIDFTAGYGAAAAVPAAVQTVILQLVLYWFENRGDVGTDIPPSVKDAIRSMTSGIVTNFYDGMV